MAKIVFALVAVLLAVGSASAARKLSAPMLPPLPIDPRAEAMAAQVTTADSLAAAVPLFSNAIWGKPTTAVSMDAFSASAPASPDGTVTVNAPADAPEESTRPPVALAPGATDSFASEGSMGAPMMAPAAAPEESTRPPVALAPGAADSFAAEGSMAAPMMAPAAAPEESTRPPVALAPGAADSFAAEAQAAPGMAPDMSPASAPEESTRPPIALAPGAADGFAAEVDTMPEVAAATEAEPET